MHWKKYLKKIMKKKLSIKLQFFFFLFEHKKDANKQRKNEDS